MATLSIEYAVYDLRDYSLVRCHIEGLQHSRRCLGPFDPDENPEGCKFWAGCPSLCIRAERVKYKDGKVLAKRDLAIDGHIQKNL